ncbi:A24 family peptidase [Noviherbaspirillum denitrificans]|uniref:Prepilin type IV endopeptidase peptidase domain-containing protein n=1 Tax=Noviherbaspirillum denitrificans TaxID=1968433 RepID=A0A254TGZ6_9BURK|nr:A24 family peptidase [Noviherbaspirillum denitrificans]OWW20572.1 hypothetical protein AYR66_14810 [Noviherbaspirillum denitrificans]
MACTAIRFPEPNEENLHMLSLTPALISNLALATLAALLGVAAWCDFTQRRIPNLLVFPGACIGLLLNAFLPEGYGFTSALPGALGILGAIKGLGLGLVLFLPMYMVRVMGAGDVKLMAMVGAFVGMNGVVADTVIVFMTGGCLSLLYLLRRKAFLARIERFFPALLLLRIHAADSSIASSSGSGKTESVPFGVAIALGTMAYIVLARQGLLGALHFLPVS